jgi:hypothetical protein
MAVAVVIMLPLAAWFVYDAVAWSVYDEEQLKAAATVSRFHAENAEDVDEQVMQLRQLPGRLDAVSSKYPLTRGGARAGRAARKWRQNVATILINRALEVAKEDGREAATRFWDQEMEDLLTPAAGMQAKLDELNELTGYRSDTDTRYVNHRNP